MLVGVTAATGGALSWFSGGKGARQEAHHLTSTLSCEEALSNYSCTKGPLC